MSPREYEFRHITRLVNHVTGEWLPVDIHIHHDDVDWCVKLWQDSFMLDWNIDHPGTERG